MPTGDGKGRRILVVDDELDIVNLLVEILTRDGHEADTAPNGAVALSLVEGREYDLILCDLRMPFPTSQGGTGFETWKKFDKDLAREFSMVFTGTLYSREVISQKQRELCAVAALTVLNREHEVRAHIHAALNVGATRQEVAEVIFQQVTYGGMPVVVEALRVFKEVLEERGEWE